MFSRTFRQLHAHVAATGLGAMFSPRKPRHPLLRVVVGLIGVALLIVLLVVGVVVGGAMLAVGLARRTLLPGGARSQPSRTIDADYRVVRKLALPLGR